ncbi:hypothetical protein PB1_08397 [Bacillus methanolicus PB1]|uniref:SbsC C-terminal domain-containing protein n=1 Tax=Bacillus methanolicus PB1 TaxID=997296 RepID=I3E1J6_BACMT|nr:Ig-like domain-containing protein [Bacillus methanolicus]EIJ80367.1 hypothetical protein PB1_08397 [Bacillus methanolicus PB1]
MKKKAIKLAAASAVAASAFVASAPAQTDAASNVAAEVSKSVTQIKKAYHTYSDVTAKGEFADIKVVYKEYNAAKAAYNNAKALVNKAGGSKKDAYLAQLDSTYNEYIKKRVVTYIDAYNYAKKLEEKKIALEKAIADKDLTAAEKYYHEISYELKSRTVILDRVYGQTTRELLRKEFKTAAQDVRDSLVNDITVVVKLRAADEAIKKGDLATADAALKVANEYLPKVTETFKAKLTEENTKVKAAYDAANTPKVESVSAINAKQVEVKFNKALDRNTVTVDNFTVTQTGDAAGSDRLTGAGATNAIGTTNTGSAVLSADGKTVILTLNNDAALTNPTTVTVTVSANVKDTSGKAIEATTKTVSFSDSSVPVAEKVETVGSNQFRVIFSETVTTAADRGANDTGADGDLNARAAFVVDNNAVAVTNVVRDPQNPKALLVTVSGNLSAGNHTVRVNPAGNALIQDYAGYSVVQTDLTYNHVADTNAPTFTAEARNERTVRLTFNKPVRIPTSNNIAIRHSYDATGAVSVLANTLGDANADGFVDAVAGSNGTQYDITFATPLPAGQVPIYVSYVNNTGLTAANSVRDSFGNTLVSGTSATVTVTRDTVAPTVTNVNVVNATTIDVTFSEDVANANVATNYNLTNPQGNPVAINSVVRQGTTNTYRLTVGSMAAGGNYTLSISNNITDTSVSANRLAPYTTTLTVGDLQAPTVGVNGVTINGARDRIYIEYSEPMATTGVNSALDVNNYRTAAGAGGAQSTLPTGTTITQNGNVVTIALPSALAANQTHLVIGQVADAAGNKIAALQTERLMGNAAAGFQTTIDQVRVTDRETVTFRVGRHLRAVNEGLITADLGTADNPAGDIQAQSASFVNNADGTATVTVKFGTAGTPNPFATDLSGFDGIDLVASALTDINNLTSAAFADVAFATDGDRVAPVLGAVTTADTNNNGQLDTITVAFDEDLYIPSVTDSDFTVEGYTITGVNVNNTVAGSVVTLTLQEKATPDTGVTPRVTLVGSVTDNSPQRNALGAQAAVTATDGAAPVFLGFTAAAGSTNVTLTFSEPVTSAALVDTTDITVTGVTGGSTISAAADATAGNTIAATLGTAPAALDDLTITFVAPAGTAKVTDGTNTLNTNVLARTVNDVQ